MATTPFYRKCLLLTCLALVLLAGCGQKGDLYLPDDEPEQQQG